MFGSHFPLPRQYHDLNPDTHVPVAKSLHQEGKSAPDNKSTRGIQLIRLDVIGQLIETRKEPFRRAIGRQPGKPSRIIRLRLVQQGDRLIALGGNHDQGIGLECLPSSLPEYLPSFWLDDTIRQNILQPGHGERTIAAQGNTNQLRRLGLGKRGQRHGVAVFAGKQMLVIHQLQGLGGIGK